MIKSITVDVISESNKITGLFRSMLSVGSREVLVIGNKKTSLFLTLYDITIKKIVLRHTENILSRQLMGPPFNIEIPISNIHVSIGVQNGERILNEEYIITKKQQAYAMLTFLYQKYAASDTQYTSASIDTDIFDIKVPYTIVSTDEEHITGSYDTEQQSETKHVQTTTALSPVCNNVRERTYIPGVSTYYKRHDIPSLISSEDMKTFLNKILGGHKYDRNYRKQGYTGQLSNCC
jgi:hypothetical protein